MIWRLILEWKTPKFATIANFGGASAKSVETNRKTVETFGPHLFFGLNFEFGVFSGVRSRIWRFTCECKSFGPQKSETRHNHQIRPLEISPGFRIQR